MSPTQAGKADHHTRGRDRTNEGSKHPARQEEEAAGAAGAVVGTLARSRERAFLSLSSCVRGAGVSVVVVMVVVLIILSFSPLLFMCRASFLFLPLHPLLSPVTAQHNMPFFSSFPSLLFLFVSFSFRSFFGGTMLHMTCPGQVTLGVALLSLVFQHNSKQANKQERKRNKGCNGNR
jgi:hypothetical protein